MKRRDLLTGLALTGMGLAAGTTGGAETGDDDKAAAPDRMRATAPGGKPRIRWAFSVTVFFDERIRIQSPGSRAFVPAVGGEIWGPRLTGRVVPYGGADYGGGGGPLDAHYLFQADDGSLIYINNRAYMKVLGESAGNTREPGPPGPGEPFSQRMGGTSLADVPLRMRTVPFFDAPKNGPYAWMNSTLFVGHGARHVNPDHTLFTYYEVL